MTNDDALFGYRQQAFAHAGRTTVAEACRTFGIHRSTYYRWKRQVERHGLEMLRPRERRRPQMPNALPKMVEERIVSFALAHPGLGPQRVASELARPKWGGICVSKNGVWRTLRRHGLSTRARRCALVAGYRAPHEPPESPSQSATSTPSAPASSSAWTAFCGTPQRHQGSGLAAHRHGCRLLVWCRPNIRGK